MSLKSLVVLSVLLLLLVIWEFMEQYMVSKQQQTQDMKINIIGPSSGGEEEDPIKSLLKAQSQPSAIPVAEKRGVDKREDSREDELPIFKTLDDESEPSSPPVVSSAEPTSMLDSKKMAEDTDPFRLLLQKTSRSQPEPKSDALSFVEDREPREEAEEDDDPFKALLKSSKSRDPQKPGPAEGPPSIMEIPRKDEPKEEGGFDLDRFIEPPSPRKKIALAPPVEDSSPFELPVKPRSGGLFSRLSASKGGEEGEEIQQPRKVDVTIKSATPTVKISDPGKISPPPLFLDDDEEEEKKEESGERELFLDFPGQTVREPEKKTPPMKISIEEPAKSKKKILQIGVPTRGEESLEKIMEEDSSERGFLSLEEKKPKPKRLSLDLNIPRREEKEESSPLEIKRTPEPGSKKIISLSLKVKKEGGDLSDSSQG